MIDSPKEIIKGLLSAQDKALGIYASIKEKMFRENLNLDQILKCFRVEATYRCYMQELGIFQACLNKDSTIRSSALLMYDRARDFFISYLVGFPLNTDHYCYPDVLLEFRGKLKKEFVN